MVAFRIVRVSSCHKSILSYDILGKIVLLTLHLASDIALGLALVGTLNITPYSLWCVLCWQMRTNWIIITSVPQKASLAAWRQGGDSYGVIHDQSCDRVTTLAAELLHPGSGTARLIYIILAILARDTPL